MKRVLLLISILTTLACSNSNQHSFSNCKEARESGAAPLHKGDQGYSSDLDKDHDGIACEVAPD